VKRIEFPVVLVVGIEKKIDEPICLAVLKPEFMEKTSVTLTAVEVQIGRDVLGLFVENVQRTIQIIHEESFSPARFIAQIIDAREQARNIIPEVLSGTRYGKGRVILNFQGNLLCPGGRRA